MEENGTLYPDNWRKKPDEFMHDSVRDHLIAGKDLKPDFDELNTNGVEKSSCHARISMILSSLSCSV
jgi:hypothetical protein